MANRSSEHVDVLVVGGGLAGFGAAVAAGRMGLDVHLLETGNTIGGVMAFCPGMPWGAAYPLDNPVGGLMTELANRLFSMQQPAAEKRACTLAHFGPEIVYDYEIATLTMFEMLEDAGVELYLNTTAITPVMSGSSIAEVMYFDKSGVRSVKPKIVIDCSGDGNIAVKAGVPFDLGDGQGNMMGATLTFHMLNANWDRVFSGNDPYFRNYAAKGIKEDRLHKDLVKLYLMKGFYPDTIFCNSVVIRNVDGTDPKVVGRATQEGRRRCRQLADFLRKDVPGFENARMANLGCSVGVRETRKLEGIYRLTGADLAQATKFHDGIVCCDNPIDDVMRGSGDMTHDAIVAEGAYYTIPFRSLVPKKIENLLFAGRIISADPVAFASIRGMPQCMIMGQATGVAAAIALDKDVSGQRIDTHNVVSILQKQGVNGLGQEPLGAVL